MTPHPEECSALPPCVILAHRERAYTAQAYRSLRKLGWDVQLAASGPEVRRLVRALEPAVVVLDTNLDEESGWLTCDKLTSEWPLVRVVLVDEDAGPENSDFASFVGAAVLIRRGDGPQVLIEEVLGATVPVIS